MQNNNYLPESYGILDPYAKQKADEQRARAESLRNAERLKRQNALRAVYGSIYTESDLFNEFDESEQAIKFADLLDPFFVEKLERIFCNYPDLKGRDYLRKQAIYFFKKENCDVSSPTAHKRIFEKYLDLHGSRELFILSDEKYFWRFRKWVNGIISSGQNGTFKLIQPVESLLFGSTFKKHFLKFDRKEFKTLAEQIAFVFSIIKGQMENESDRLTRLFGYNEEAELTTFFKFYGFMVECAKQLGLSMPLETADYSPNGVTFNEFLPEPLNVRKANEIISRLTYPRTWFKLLKITQERTYEHFSRSAGQVRAGKSAYISEESFQQFLIFEENNLKFLENSKLKSLDGLPDEKLTLLNAYESSVSNPKNRVAELNVRARGVDDYARSLDCKAVFITATAPSMFHSYAKKGKNPKFKGYDPREAQAWLMKVWGLVRADFAQHNLDIIGIRCCEPHGDATPHLHFILYVKNQAFDERFARINGKGEIISETDLEKAINLMRNAWLRTDPDGFIAFSKGGKAILDDKGRIILDECNEQGEILKRRSSKSKAWSDGRFNYKLLDWSKGGSPMGYVFKYISKNVFSEDKKSKSDEDSTLNLADNSARVRAWANRWGIRQFQFFGTPPITVYREMRKLKPSEREFINGVPKAELDRIDMLSNLDDFQKSVYEASIESEFDKFIRLMKGDKEKCYLGKPAYDVAQGAGIFGNDVKKIWGVQLGDSLVKTRFFAWEVERAIFDGGRYNENTSVSGYDFDDLIDDETDLGVAFEFEEEESGAESPPSAQSKGGNPHEVRRGAGPPTWSSRNNCNSG